MQQHGPHSASAVGQGPLPVKVLRPGLLLGLGHPLPHGRQEPEVSSGLVLFWQTVETALCRVGAIFPWRRTLRYMKWQL